jgi:hypothetical protein
VLPPRRWHVMGKGGEIHPTVTAVDRNKLKTVGPPTDVDLSYLIVPALDQFRFFERAVPFVQAASDAELADCAWLYAQHIAERIRAARDGAPAPASADFRVELMWRTHLLSPATYAKDCGTLIDHTPASSCELQGPVAPTESVESPAGASWVASLDLVAAVRRQLPFMEKMLALRSTFESDDFMKAAVQRYGMFLAL